MYHQANRVKNGVVTRIHVRSVLFQCVQKGHCHHTEIKNYVGRHGGGIRCEGGTSLQPCNKLAMSPTPRDGSKILRRLCIACGGGYKCIILGCKTASKKHGLCSLHGGNPSRKCRLKKVADDVPLQSLKLVFTTEGNEDTLQVTLIPISEENTIKTKRRKILDETLSHDGEIIML